MARKAASSAAARRSPRAARQAARPGARRRSARARPTVRAPLTSLISSLHAKASSLVSTVRSARPVSAAGPRRADTTPTSGAEPDEPAVPIPSTAPARPTLARRSTVKKPPRGPTRRPSRSTPIQQPAAQSSARGSEHAEPDVASALPTPIRPFALGSGVRGRADGGGLRARRAAAAGQERSVEERFSFPTGYGTDQLVLLVKDPWWLYAYWEIQPATERAVRSRLLPQEVAGFQTILRVHDVTGLAEGQGPRRTFDIILSGLAKSWHIHTGEPGHAYVVEIGILANSGRFLPLARSNRAQTPRFSPSEVTDPAWDIDEETFQKLLSLSAGAGVAPGASAVSSWGAHPVLNFWSGNWASHGVLPQARQPAVQGFWCRLDTDLVFYGATEPKATVTIQGQPVAVRKDGTFTVRLALPEGTQTVTIDVASADGRQVRTLSPIVTQAGLSVQEAAGKASTMARGIPPAMSPGADTTP